MRRNINLRRRAVAVATALSAPVYATDFSGPPLILGQPSVGATVALLSGTLSAGSPAPTITYQWYRGEKWEAGTAIAGATSSSFTPTLKEYMKEVWVTETATNASGTASSTSYRMRCLPTAGMSAKTHAGHTPDAGQINDPSLATAYVATTLYACGDMVTDGASTYFCREPWSCGVQPSTNTAYWQVVANVFYLDTSAATNGTGTKASPFNTIEEFRYRTMSTIAPYVDPGYGAVFLFKRGTTVNSSFRINVGGTRSNFLFGCYGTTTVARPIIKWAPPPQLYMNSTGSYGDCIYFHNANATGGRVCNIDTDGDFKQMYLIDGGETGGSLIVGDTVTATAGGVGVLCTVAHRYTLGAGSWIVLRGIARNDQLPIGATVITKGAITATCTGLASTVGGLGCTEFALDVGYANCSGRNSGGGSIGHEGASSETALMSTYPGDHFIVNCLCENSGLYLYNGAGGGASGHVQRHRAFFNTTRDCGQIGATSNHQIYVGGWKTTAGLFLRMENTTASTWGNHAFVYHGKVEGAELGWCYCKDTKSGIGINDGYSAGSIENMYDFHVHNNFLTGHTAIAWEVTCVEGFRCHNNVTVNSSDSSFYEDRAYGSTHTKLDNVVLAHNTWHNAGVYLGKFDGTGMVTVASFKEFNNIYSKTTAAFPYAKGYTLPDASLEKNGNLYYRADAGAVIQWNNGGPGGAAYASAAALNAAVPAFEAAGKTGNPLFVNTTTGDYRLNAGSPGLNMAVDARRKIGWAADYNGVARLTATPTVGAYEGAFL